MEVPSEDGGPSYKGGVSAGRKADGERKDVERRLRIVALPLNERCARLAE